MRLYVRECHRIATSMIYFLFIAVMVFSWFLNFKGVTSTEIDWANGIRPADIGFDRALLSRPSPDDESFGSRTSEDHPEAIMTGVTRALLAEYKSNSYAKHEKSSVSCDRLSVSDSCHQRNRKSGCNTFCGMSGTISITDRNISDRAA